MGKKLLRLGLLSLSVITVVLFYSASHHSPRAQGTEWVSHPVTLEQLTPQILPETAAAPRPSSSELEQLTLRLLERRERLTARGSGVRLHYNDFIVTAIRQSLFLKKYWCQARQTGNSSHRS